MRILHNAKVTLLAHPATVEVRKRYNFKFDLLTTFITNWKKHVVPTFFTWFGCERGTRLASYRDETVCQFSPPPWGLCMGLQAKTPSVSLKQLEIQLFRIVAMLQNESAHVHGQVCPHGKQQQQTVQIYISQFCMIESIAKLQTNQNILLKSYS